jgi:ABC-type cobalt transport system substrate-binding protein
VAHTGRDEEMTWHLVYRMKDGEVFYALFVQQLYEPPSGTAEFVLYGWCHHLSAEASIAW